MKCKLCGAVHDDDNLYFCITCGAMLKNPMTKKVVEENIEGETSESVSDTTELTEVEETPKILPAPADIPAPELPELSEVEKLSEIEENSQPLPVPPVLVIEEKEDIIPPIAEKADENFIADMLHDKPQEELHIAKEREKFAINQEIPPVRDEIPTTEITAVAPKKIGFGRLFGAFFIALFTGIILVAVSLLFSLKLGLTGDNLNKTIKKMDNWTVVNAKINNMTVSDNLYFETNFDKASHNFADTTDFALYLAGTDFTGFCADKARIYADYIIDGKGKEPTLTENEIADFFIANHDRGVEIFGYEMQTADYNSIRTSLAENETAEKLSVSRIGWDMKFHLENVKYILSYLTLGILVAVVAVLMIWISAVVRYKGKYILGFIGNIFTWSGIAVIIGVVSASAGAALAHNITGNFLCYLSSTLLLPSAMYGACIGALLLVTGLIIKKIKSSIRIREKIQKAINSKGNI